MTARLEKNLISDEALAALAAREESGGAAFEQLVERFSSRVWRICWRLMGNEHDAHDAAQEVFTRLFFQRRRYDGGSLYATWVHAVAVRTCLELRRKRSRRQQHETTGVEVGLSSGKEATSDRASSANVDLQDLLELLDEEDRALLLLKYTEGYEYEELAALFDLSLSACKMRISRARQKLRRLSGEKIDEQESADDET